MTCLVFPCLSNGKLSTDLADYALEVEVNVGQVSLVWKRIQYITWCLGLDHDVTEMAMGWGTNGLL